MGLYDRPYYRDEAEFSWKPQAHWSGVNMIIAICVGVYLLDILTMSLDPKYRLVTILACYNQDVLYPWRWFSFLTYAFMHSPLDAPGAGIFHILMNMFVLWMFGRFVESHMGREKFLRFYLVTAFLCGVLYSLFWFALGSDSAKVGASGAVSAVLVYFIFLNPRVTLLLFGVIPMPAWALGIGILIYDFLGSLGNLAGRSDGVAHESHLIGAAIGAIYYRYGFPGETWLQSLRQWWRRRHLRVVRAAENRDQAQANEADQLLEKVSRSGYDSLTAKEKKILEEYSRKLRNKR